MLERGSTVKGVIYNFHLIKILFLAFKEVAMTRLNAIFSKKIFKVIFLALFFLTPHLIEGQNLDDEPQNRYYITVHSGMFTGTSYPNVFDGYKATGSAPANYYYPRNFANPGGSYGFGGNFGYLMDGELLKISGEIEFSMITHSDDKETLEETNWSNYQTQSYTNVFTQSKRNNSIITANANLGIFPFTDFNLGFYVSIGFGVGWQSFHSEATAYAERKGYNVKMAAGYESHDLGDYSNGGDFSRSSFIYLIGLGSELFISRRISLKVDYKYIGSSYTRENVLISSGPVNVYQDKKSYEYTFANKISLGASYYFGE